MYFPKSSKEQTEVKKGEGVGAVVGGVGGGGGGNLKTIV